KKAEAPGNVPNTPKEDKLNEFELKPAAEERLGIVTTPIERRPTVRMRMYGGEVVLPTGASLIVTAPLGGFLKSPPKGGIPAVGELVRKGQPIFELVPGLSKEQLVLSPADRVNLFLARTNLAQSRNSANAQLEQADEQVKAAKIELDRAEMLLKANSGTRQTVDRAKATLALAEKSYDAALDGKKLWDSVQLDEESLTFKPLEITAPQDGIIRVENVAANEAVAAGAPLFEVMNPSIAWVKVPVYVGEIREIAADQPARLSDVEDRVGAGAVVAKPVSAPPTALAISSTADLYYEIENREGYFRPGQKVNANLALREEREGLVISWSAVVHDINGGTWVYESLPEHKYVRHRVQVKYVVDSTAVLASGPAIGAKIVTEGAAELFGFEFGFAK
ncbi:MAG TPA: HlyD family efflux transporter periplasmic adaptor subunit, partial [Planctomycetaceae bacterium]|nr:HlyD family efflux transporter periplasmic adaptor subunit [Planctomycetaceae bacterium]